MEEQRLKAFAESCRTPAYVFDTDILKERIRRTAKILHPAKLCFAIKANPFLLKSMDGQVEHYEVCSPGEFHICVQNGLDMEKIVLSGVNKEYGDVRYAMEQGVIRYTAESRHQFELVHQCAAELQKTVEILLRVTSGNQFGMSEEDVVHLIQHREEYPHLDVVGVQYFSGTQKKNIRKIAGELEYIEDFIRRLFCDEGFSVRVLEFGPGLGVPYFTKDDQQEDQKLLEAFGQLFQEKRPYELVFEMGRFLTASCGYYITKIVDQKKKRCGQCVHRGRRHPSRELLRTEYGHEDPGFVLFSAASGGSRAGRKMDRLWFLVHGSGYSSEKSASFGCQAGGLSGLSQHRGIFGDRRNLSVFKQKDAGGLSVSGRKNCASAARAGDLDFEHMEE